MITSDRENLVVVLGADDRYAMQLSVTIASILTYLKPNRSIQLFIIDNGLKESNKNKIEQILRRKKCSLTWLKAPETINNLPVLQRTPNITLAAYGRLFISELLPQTYQKAIYLDSDLVVERDLGELWEIEVGDNYLLAVQDLEIPFISSPYGISRYQELGLAPNLKYFNSGVLVINLAKWRADNIGAKAIAYQLQNKEYLHHHDQEGLNAVVAGQWGELDPRWNQQTSIYKYPSWQNSPFSEFVYQQLVFCPYIVHFTGTTKPWNSNLHPLNHLFFQYLDLTPWSGWRFTSLDRLLENLSWKSKQLRRLAAIWLVVLANWTLLPNSSTEQEIVEKSEKYGNRISRMFSSQAKK